MAHGGSQLTIQSADFDKIRKETGQETVDFLTRLWYILNDETRLRRQGDRINASRIRGGLVTDAPTTQQDDYDAGSGTLFVYFNGSTPFTLTGIRNGQAGRRLVIHNGGSATVTIADDSASSATTNRILTSTGGNKSLTTDKTITLNYLDSRWREDSPI